ncbi:MAG: UDP-N-acetylmuramyl-tripeptide synthetase [Minisyncoccia bacterium]
MKNTIKSVMPSWLLSAYHFSIAFLAALLYRFPSRHLVVIAVTGTKGKSSTLEFLNAIFEAAGHRTALSSTIRFKIDDVSQPNLKRMTVPGRFFLQSFLSKAYTRNCSIALIELTSEGARQFRHRFISLDCLIFLNLAPEHIESHGSLEAYADAKFELGQQLLRSRKRRVMVANADDKESARFLALPADESLPFSLSLAQPFEAGERGGFFTFDGFRIDVRLPGVFSLTNALAAATAAQALGIPTQAIARGIASVERIPGRAEEIVEGQQFPVIVDYAHTPDSLAALYSAFNMRRKICVLGATGGGRDLWKRPVMGAVAEKFCDTIIITNEDPYDEDPRSIMDMIVEGISEKKPDMIPDRREAIRRALEIARASDAVLITGKGTDPTIQGPRGTSVPWSDAEVAREELRKLLGKR